MHGLKKSTQQWILSALVEGISASGGFFFSKGIYNVIGHLWAPALPWHLGYM